ncbi:hypothetical protein MRX96_036125 [Rhipicephalus microplus]
MPELNGSTAYLYEVKCRLRIIAAAWCGAQERDNEEAARRPSQACMAAVAKNPFRSRSPPASTSLAQPFASARRRRILYNPATREITAPSPQYYTSAEPRFSAVRRSEKEYVYTYSTASPSFRVTPLRASTGEKRHTSAPGAAAKEAPLLGVDTSDPDPDHLPQRRKLRDLFAFRHI